MCCPKYVELYINHGLINFDKLLHLVGFFCMNYTMIHGSTNIKFIITSPSFPSLSPSLPPHSLSLSLSLSIEQHLL
jgi:hypothetical protein